MHAARNQRGAVGLGLLTALVALLLAGPAGAQCFVCTNEDPQQVLFGLIDEVDSDYLTQSEQNIQMMPDNPAYFLAEDGKGFQIDTEAARRWLSYIQRMHEEGMATYTTSDDEGYQKWKTGATGSFYAAQGHVMELVSVTEDESDIAYLGWPGAQENGSIIWTHSAWIPKVSERIDLAKQFIRDVVFSKRMQQWSFNNYGKLPVMKDYYGEGITWFQDSMPTILNIADNSQPIPLYADLQEYLDILQKYLPEAAFGRMSVDQALNNVQQEVQGLDFSNLRATE